MSGHSKWHTIKHKKGAADAKRGRVFTRIIKEISVAARAGGGDADSNPRLRTVIADAKAVNMPAENIKRAIRRGTGEEPGVNYEEVTYEAYGPGGTAIILEGLTDNKNRTVATELRHLLDKYNGKMADRNTALRKFSKRGQIIIEKLKVAEDALMAAVLEAGADDMQDDDDSWEVLTAPEAFDAVREAVRKLEVERCERAAVAMVPFEYVKLTGKEAQSMMKLMDVLEDHERTSSASGRTSTSTRRRSRPRSREGVRDRSRFRTHPAMGGVESDGSRHRLVACGAIVTSPRLGFPAQLLRIHQHLAALLAEHRAGFGRGRERVLRP